VHSIVQHILEKYTWYSLCIGAEKPLPANSNCLLGSINLSALVKNGFEDNAKFDFEEFEEILFGLMKKELKHVEIIGLFLGGLIGFIQYLVSYFL